MIWSGAPLPLWAALFSCATSRRLESSWDANSRNVNSRKCSRFELVKKFSSEVAIRSLG